jgi:hypothetical protein
MACIVPRAPEAKVFWFFSSEKNIVCLVPCVLTGEIGGFQTARLKL